MRWTVAAVFSAVLISWSALHYRRAYALASWEAQPWEARYEVLRRDPSAAPRRTAVLDDAARSLSDEIFPPDREGSRRALLEAIRLTPLRSSLWLLLAEQSAFLGRTAEARAALEFADWLDPSYPDQRLASVQLWTLLGEREKALDQARRIAALDATGRDEAAQALLRAGFSGDEITRVLGLDTLGPGEMAGVLDILARTSPEKLRQIMDGLPAATLDDAAFRLAAARAFSSPPDPAIVRRLWFRHSPSVRSFRIGAAEVMADNLDLEASPFENLFFYGWQPLPDAASLEAVWLIAAQTPDRFPQVRVDFGSGYEREAKGFRWTFYRLPIPATAEPLVVELPVRSIPPEFSRLRLTVRNGTASWRGKESETVTPEWSTLRVTVPPSDAPRLLDLQLERQRRGNARAREVSVFLGPLRLTTPAALERGS